MFGGQELKTQKPALIAKAESGTNLKEAKNDWGEVW